MKVNMIFGTHAQHVRKTAQRKIAGHIKTRINDLKEVVGQ